MYQFSYADIQSDSAADAKDRERQLLTRSIDLLVAARDAGAGSMQAVEAVQNAVSSPYWLGPRRRLWPKSDRCWTPTASRLFTSARRVLEPRTSLWSI